MKKSWQKKSWFGVYSVSGTFTSTSSQWLSKSLEVWLWQQLLLGWTGSGKFTYHDSSFRTIVPIFSQVGVHLLCLCYPQFKGKREKEKWFDLNFNVLWLGHGGGLFPECTIRMSGILNINTECANLTFVQFGKPVFDMVALKALKITLKENCFGM